MWILTTFVVYNKFLLLAWLRKIGLYCTLLLVGEAAAAGGTRVVLQVHLRCHPCLLAGGVGVVASARQQQAVDVGLEYRHKARDIVVGEFGEVEDEPAGTRRREQGQGEYLSAITFILGS